MQAFLPLKDVPGLNEPMITMGQQQPSPMLPSPQPAHPGVMNSATLAMGELNYIGYQMENLNIMGAGLSTYAWKTYTPPAPPTFTRTSRAIATLKQPWPLFRNTAAVLARGMRQPAPLAMPGMNVARFYEPRFPVTPVIPGVSDIKTQLTAQRSNIITEINNMKIIGGQLLMTSFESYPNPEPKLSYFAKAMFITIRNFKKANTAFKTLSKAAYATGRISGNMASFLGKTGMKIADMIGSFPGIMSNYMKVSATAVKRAVVGYVKASSDNITGYAKLIGVRAKAYMTALNANLKTYLVQLRAAMVKDIKDLTETIRIRMTNVTNAIRRDMGSIPAYIKRLSAGLQQNITNNINRLKPAITEEIKAHVSAFNKHVNNVRIQMVKNLNNMTNRLRREYNMLHNRLVSSISQAKTDFNRQIGAAKKELTLIKDEVVVHAEDIKAMVTEITDLKARLDKVEGYKLPTPTDGKKPAWQFWGDEIGY